MKIYTAIVLAAGSGKRMNAKVQKQYLEVAGKPILYYTLKAFEESGVTEIVLVTGAGQEEYCRREIIEKYSFQKIKKIVAGGKERYHSVYEGLLAAKGADYVLIHDGARPMVDGAVIQRSMEAAEKYQACAAGVPAKDTIKIVNEEQIAKETPDRSRVWQVQTPQAFSYPLILEAYGKLMETEGIAVTDDAMVVERMTSVPVKMIEGSYRNIKITTPDDLLIAEMYLGA